MIVVTYSKLFSTNEYVRSLSAEAERFFGASTIVQGESCYHSSVITVYFDNDGNYLRGTVSEGGDRSYRVTVGLTGTDIRFCMCSCIAVRDCKHGFALLRKFARKEMGADLKCKAGGAASEELKRVTQAKPETVTSNHPSINKPTAATLSQFSDKISNNEKVRTRAQQRLRDLHERRRLHRLGSMSHSPRKFIPQSETGAPSSTPRDTVLQVIPHLVIRCGRGAMAIGARAVNRRQRPRLELTLRTPDGSPFRPPSNPGVNGRHYINGAAVKIDYSLATFVTDELKAREFERVWLEQVPGDSVDVKYFTAEKAKTWVEFINAGVEKFRGMGCQVDIDDSFAFEIVEPDGPIKASIVRGVTSWFCSIEMTVSIDKREITLLSILMDCLKDVRRNCWLENIDNFCVDSKFWVMLKDGRFLALPQNEIHGLVQQLSEVFESNIDSATPLLLQPFQVLKLMQEEDLHIDWTDVLPQHSMVRNFKKLPELPDLELPKIFKAKLRPYQNAGVKWLQFLRTYSLGGILADDMGLGKTVQTLAHISIEKAEKRLASPFLVVCPTSVLPNWIAECAKWCPRLKVLKYAGSNRQNHDASGTFSGFDVVITTYQLVLNDLELLKSIAWHGVILDEAQAIKNPSSKISQAVRRLNSSHRITLTGTPIENRLSDLWSQFSFLIPGALGDFKSFKKNYANPIEKFNHQATRESLSSSLAPFILRRNKTEVEPDLPPKSIIIKRVDLSAAQRTLYETIRLSMYDNVKQQIDLKGLKASSLQIFSALLRLRQACCDPRLLPPELADTTTDSAKLSMLREMLPELISENRKILLFSQFTSMLDLIKPLAEELNIPFVELRGDTRDRATPVERFQSGKVPLFLISLKAGGMGLNLTAADTVIHFDPWWNPAVENQATDRAYRIGQDKPVFVYKLITSGTVEETVLDLQEKKSDLANAVLGNDFASNFEFGEGEIDRLFSPIS